ncbi:MAG: hypothetical protein ACRDPM_12465 [Solirubrobacteraceae bacterium]
MTARHRGDTRIHSRWRPTAEQLVAHERGQRGLADDSSVRPRRKVLAVAGVLAVAVITAMVVIAAMVVGGRGAGRAKGAALPATPRRWVEQWTVASLDSPGRVCGQLFASALAGAFSADTGRSCLSYYSDVTSRSFRIRHVLQDGPTAAVEAQQVGEGRKWGYFTMVLSHVHGGWQAVDIVPGGSVRPR